jgi:hypothetical protein
MKKQIKIVSMTLIMLLFFASVTYASGLTFTPENVYYEGNTVVVYGYWLNETNKYIPYTNWVNMDVYTRNGGHWDIIARAQFTQRSHIDLLPGESRYWTYRIYNSRVASLYHWWVQTEANYHWQTVN